MAITRTPFVDDSGSGQDGTVINNAWKQELYDQIDAASASASSETLVIPFGATLHNLALTPQKYIHQIVVGGGTGSLSITGCANGKVGDLLIIGNEGGVAGQDVFLYPANGGSAANAQFFHQVSSGPIVLAGVPAHVGGVVVYLYDGYGNRWRLIAHEQGAPAAVPFAAGNFTANSGSWTVASGNVSQKYRLRGNVCEVYCDIYGTTTTGAGNTLHVAAWPYTFAPITPTPYRSAITYFPPWDTCLVSAMPNAATVSMLKKDGQAWGSLATCNFGIEFSAVVL